jgi:hypothetical protein
MKDLRAGGFIALIAGALIALAWLLMPPRGLPLYDGLGLPPEAYRYLQPPPNTFHSNKKPTSGVVSLVLGNKTLPEEDVYTTEQPPQAQLILPADAAHVPPNAGKITISVRPVPPPGQPSSGAIEGNVYAFAITTQSGASIPLRSKTSATIELRDPNLRDSPVIAHYDHGSWVSERTGKFLGTPIFGATVSSLGDYALIGSGRGAATATGSTWIVYVVIGAIIVALTAVGLVLIRLSRGRAAESA